MNQQEYLKLRKELIDLAQKIMDDKQPEYTNNNVDVLHNFKSSAKRIGIDPLQVWATFLDKHIQAIFSHASNPNMIKAEPIETRYADALNYLILGMALVVERNKSQHEDLNLIYKSIE
jgi:hypothetical protein